MAHYAMFRISLFARPAKGGLLLRKNAPQRWRVNAFLLCFLSFSVLITGCGLGKKEDRSTYEERTNRNGGDDVITVSDEDQEMSSAIEKAQSTLEDFEKALKSKNPKFEYFSLKVVFNGEHMWISSNWMENGKYYGILDSDPLYEENMKMQLGDTIKINTADITDWQYIVGDTIIGSYTTRVLRNKMSKQERDDFDAQTNLMYK